MFGGKLGTVILKSGNVFNSFDGKRVILEIGCNTVIYLLINQKNKKSHHRFFIQKSEEFLFDVFTRTLADQVSKAAGPAITIAKYEMYFMMGLFSTVSVPMWLIIAGSDITHTLSVVKHKEQAFSKLAKVILEEMNNISRYAPTLHMKLMQLVKAERDKTIANTWQELPKAVVTDEKTQAQTAGILYGKYAVSPKSLNVWGALLTVLLQATIKSASNLPDAYLSVIDKRYADKVRALTNTNWYDMRERKQAVMRIASMLKESGVQISPGEIEKIILEVQKHPDKLQKSVVNMMNAYKEFRRTIH
jgi:hypothetical protein